MKRRRLARLLARSKIVPALRLPSMGDLLSIPKFATAAISRLFTIVVLLTALMASVYASVVTFLLALRRLFR